LFFFSDSIPPLLRRRIALGGAPIACASPCSPPAVLLLKKITALTKRRRFLFRSTTNRRRWQGETERDRSMVSSSPIPIFPFFPSTSVSGDSWFPIFPQNGCPKILVSRTSRRDDFPPFINPRTAMFVKFYQTDPFPLSTYLPQSWNGNVGQPDCEQLPFFPQQPDFFPKPPPSSLIRGCCSSMASFSSPPRLFYPARFIVLRRSMVVNQQFEFSSFTIPPPRILPPFPTPFLLKTAHPFCHAFPIFIFPPWESH